MLNSDAEPETMVSHMLVLMLGASVALVVVSVSSLQQSWSCQQCQHVSIVMSASQSRSMLSTVVICGHSSTGSTSAAVLVLLALFRLFAASALLVPLSYILVLFGHY